MNSLIGGGAEKSSRIIFNELAKNGIDIEMLAINKTVQKRYSGNLREIELERNWKDGLVSTIKNYLLFVKKLREIKPSILVAHCELPELFIAFLPMLKVNYVVVEHTSTPWNGRKLLGRLVRSLLRIKRAQWVSVTSTRPSIWFGSRIPKVILNPVDQRQINSQGKVKEKFVYIGRLRKEKRPQMAIDAVINCGQAISIIGEGELIKKLQFDYAKYSDKVKFHGFVENPWKIIRDNSLIIVPSEYEGDCLVAVEAIINGFPILLSDIPDLRRFNLPSKHYFKNSEDLREKISLALIKGNSYFVPPLIKQNELKSERNLGEITLKWICLFRSLTN